MKKKSNLWAWYVHGLRKILLVMKICSCLLLCMMLSVSAMSYSQNKKLTMEKKSENLLSVLKEQGQVSDYEFFYNDNEVNRYQVSFSVKDASVVDVLEEILKGIPLSYRMVDNVIVITPRELKEEAPKKIVITGIVKEKGGDILPGVTVLLKGTAIGTATDASGQFRLELPRQDSLVLLFSFIGMKSREVNVGKQTELIVFMEPDVEEMEEVVCTGYQTLKKVNTTGSFSSISPQAIELRGSAGLNRLLEGQVPGLTIYNNDVRIRGGSTISEKVGTKPLYIVDGFEVDELPENMDQVERITVLKDAAAAAIWGTRAANGVIVIEMKKGAIGRGKLLYSGNVNVMMKPDFDDLNRADSKTVVDYDLEVFDKGLLHGSTYNGRAYGYSPSYGLIFDYENNKISRTELEEKLAALGTISNEKQIEDKLLRSAIRHNHTLSLSGGNEAFAYFLSGSYTGENSVYKDGSENSTFNILSKNSYSVTSRVKVRADINAVYGKENLGYNVESEIRSIQPYQLLVDEEGNRVKDYAKFNVVKNQDLMEQGYKDYGFNILDEVDLANNKTSKFSLRTKLGLDVTILEGLQMNMDYQYERIHSKNKNLRDEESYYVRDLLNYMTNVENGELVNHLPMGNILDMTTTDLTAHALKVGGVLNRTFGKKGEHYVNVVGGFELRKRTSESSNYRRLGYNDELLTYQLFDEQTLAKNGIYGWNGWHRYYADSYNSFSYRDNREVSYYGSAVYTYDARYTLSGTFRVDESNLFGAAKKYRRNPLWSVGMSWNVHNEDFFHSNVINRLTTRVTYGLTGNFDRSGSSTPLLTVRRNFNSAIGAYYARVSNAPNPKLRWERTKTLNLGVEAELFHCLALSLEYYDKRSYDLLGNIQLDPTLGFDGEYINGANMWNKGIEAQLNAKVLERQDFQWFVNFVFGYNKNKITNNAILDSNPAYNLTHGLTEFVAGHPREALWSYRWAGLDENGNPLTYDADGNKTDVAVAESVECNGTYRPKYSGSFSTDFKYKSLTLMFSFIYNFGHVFRVAYPTMDAGSAAKGSTANLSAFVGKRWMKPGDEAITDIPSIRTKDYRSNDRASLAVYSSNSVRKGDFIRLREITLNYELPKQLVKKSPFARVSLTAQANTVWMWTKNKEGFDPEVVEPVRGTLGLSEAPSFTFGLKVEF